MKTLLITIILGYTFSVFSQTSNPDTLHFRDGTTQIGQFVMEAVTDYKFVIAGEKIISSFPKYDVRKIVYGDGKIYWDADNKNAPLQTENKSVLDSKTSVNAVTDYNINNENLLLRFKELNNRIRQSGIYSMQAGKWGISASVLFLSGAAMTLAGAFTGIPELTYTGAGIGGTGLVLLIPTFVKLKKSGTVLHQRNAN